MDARLAAGEQAMLFLNRRGFAPITLCRACGHQIGCDDCDARMVEHQVPQAADVPSMRRNQTDAHGLPIVRGRRPHGPCWPRCGTVGGRGRQGLLWPDARIAVLSSDMYGSARALKAEIAGIAELVAADIVIGTQLVAKGHNFPNLTSGRV